MKGKLRAALLPIVGVVLMLLMLLPMTVAVGASNTDTVEGFAYRPQYKSQWNEKYGTRKASWGNQWWPANDGDYNGAVCWTNNNEKISIRDEQIGGVTTGVLQLVETTGLFALFNPGARIEYGPTLIRFDFKYTTSGFAGFDLSCSSNCIFRVDAKGQVYAGSTTSYSDLRTAAGLDKSAPLDGWYTVEAFFIPVDEAGEVVTVPVGTSDASSYTANIQKNNVYVRFSSYADPRPDTNGITLQDLNSSARKFEWTSSSLLKFYRDLGSSTTLKPTVAGSGTLSIANAEATLLVPSASLHKVSYIGTNGRLNQYAYTTAEANELTVPTAPGLKAWQAVDADGNTAYYAPGNRMTVTSNTEMTMATGANQIKTATLRTVVQNMQVEKLYLYSYSQILEQIDALDTAMAACSHLSATDSLWTAAQNERTLLAEQAEKIATAGERLISAAAVFADQSKSFSDRVDAYETVMHGFYDATYKTGADDTRMTTALLARDAFSIQYNRVYEQWSRYLAACEAIRQTVGSENIERAVLDLVTSDAYTEFAMAFASGEPDTELTDIYFSCLAGVPAKLKSLYTVGEKYAYLKERLENYNTFKLVVYGKARAVAVPDCLKQAVEIYNAAANAMNDELAAAATISLTVQDWISPCTATTPMLSDIQRRLNALAVKQDEE